MFEVTEVTTEVIDIIGDKEVIGGVADVSAIMAAVSSGGSDDVGDCDDVSGTQEVDLSRSCGSPGRGPEVPLSDRVVAIVADVLLLSQEDGLMVPPMKLSLPLPRLASWAS